MADRLRELLPSWARQVDELDYGLRLDEPGLYYVHRGGRVRAVGVAELGGAPSWADDKGGAWVTALLTVAADGRSARTRGRTWSTAWENGTLRTANGYTEDDDVRPAGTSLEKWLEADVTEKVKRARGVRG